MTQEELNEILELHKKWLNGKEGGKMADLAGANLKGVKLQEANLQGANLTGANLTGANLIGANLNRVNLSEADLNWANLNWANLSEADLRGANIDNVIYNENTAFFALQCPEDGAFIAYKKVYDVIIKLEVPEDAKRSSATTRKCRCSKAKVLGFYDLDKNELDMDEVVNRRYVETIYHKGEMVFPDSWDDNRWEECSNGIHFFLTFEEAKIY